MDSSQSVVRKTLDAFDQGKTVAYPTRISMRLGTLLPRFLPRGLVTNCRHGQQEYVPSLDETSLSR